MVRPDGRRPDQLRPVRIERHYLMHAEGSVLIEVGSTRVICAATVEDKVPPFLRGTGRGWITAEYAMLPRATPVRNAREVAKGRPSGRSQEIQRLVGRSLRSVVDLAALGERTILLDCDVIQADGGTRTASVTGAFVALVDALLGLRESAGWEILPVTDFLAATSVGILNGEPLLDLSFAEDSQAQVDMNLVLTGSGRLVEIQGTAEQAPFTEEELGKLLALGKKGVQELIEIQRLALGEAASLVGGWKKSGDFSAGDEE